MIEATKKEVAIIMDRHKEYLEKIQVDREQVNQVFEMMEEYCRKMGEVVTMAQQAYPTYIIKRLQKEEKQCDQEIDRLEKGLFE